jgi:hypothetical protein
MSFSKVLSKKLNFAKYENRLHFFLEVLSKQLDFVKYPPTFFQGSFKETQPLQNKKSLVFFKVSFQGTQSNFVFSFEIFEFLVFGFLFPTMEKARSLNI